MSYLKRKFGFIMVMVVLMAIIIMPSNIKAVFPDSAVKDWLNQRNIRLGLDLQGGTQLDYNIDLSQAKAYNDDDDPENDVNLIQLVEGVKTTISRRVNSLGVSEAIIQVSDIAGEKHIIVELPGVKDLDEAKAAVGKTIQLEFKEESDELTDVETNKIRNQADGLFKQLTATGADFADIGRNAMLANNRVTYVELENFKNELGPELADAWDLEEGEVYPELIQGNIVVESERGEQRVKGLVITKSFGKTMVDREETQKGEDFLEVAKEVSNKKDEVDPGLKFFAEIDANVVDKIWEMNVDDLSENINNGEYLELYKLITKQEEKDEVQAKHILIAHSEMDNSREGVERTKEEALERANEVKVKIDADIEKFDELAVEYSDDPTAESNKGDLGSFGRGVMVPAFEEIVFGLEDGRVSDPVETPFGYHVIYKYGRVKEAAKNRFYKISVSKSETDAEGILASVRERVQDKTVTKQEEKIKLQTVFISLAPDGWKTTGLDGRYFRRAVVSRNDLNRPYVAIEFDDEGAKLFEEITGRNIDKPVAIFVGGELVSAPTVQEKIAGGRAQITGRYTYKEAVDLKNNLNAGAIPAPIYLIGQYQIGATLGEESLQKSLISAIAGLCILLLYLIIYYRFLGLLASFALMIYTVILLFVLHISSLTSTPIVLTLAGIAGIILSIGMAVDANILIFERFKEELKNGKNFTAAINTGFQRAWSSIRDSNLSTIITCIILAWFGSSIIRGFAIMLGIGVLISMFTAIVVTKTFLQLTSRTKISEIPWLFAVKEIVEDFRRK